MSTKAFYSRSEIGPGKVGFAKTRSIIEAAFYGNNVVKIKSVDEAYELAKNSSGTIVTDLPVYNHNEQGLAFNAKVLLFNDGSITGRYKDARRIAGEPGVKTDELDKIVMRRIFEFDVKDSVVNTQLNALRKQLNNIDDDISVQIKKLNDKKNHNTKALNNLVTALANGASELTMAAINNKIEELNNENQLIDTQICELNDKDIIQAQLHRNLNSLEDAIVYLKDNFENLSIENKREYIKKIIKRVVWTGNAAIIFIKDSTI